MNFKRCSIPCRDERPVETVLDTRAIYILCNLAGGRGRRKKTRAAETLPATI